MSMGTMLAQAAVECGRHAVYMPSYGPEQRGGSAKCTVIIDSADILSPMAKTGGILVAMSQLAYDKYIDTLEPGGILIYDNTMITGAIERGDITAIPVPAADLAREAGAPRAANVLVDGVLLGIRPVVSPEEFQKSLDAKFAKKSQDVRDSNTRAFNKGLELGKNRRSA